MIQFRRHITLGEYLDTIGRKPERQSKADLRRDGVMVTVRAADVSGTKQAYLYGTLRDEPSDRDLPLWRRQRCAILQIQAAGDSGAARCWAPAPAQPGRYLVDYELETSGGTFLDEKKTEEFAVG